MGATMSDSMYEFLRSGRKGKAVDLEKLSRYTVDNDRWDRRDFDRLLTQIPELSAARHRLAQNVAGDCGYDEGADALWMLYKINPELLEDFAIRPSRLVNKRVNEELEKLAPYLNVRRWTQGEPVGAALAFEKMEPDIEILYDRLHEELEKQKEYEEAVQKAIEAAQDELTAQEMIDQWLDAQPEPEPSEGDEDGQGTPIEIPAELQAALDQARQEAAQAQARAEQTLEDLQAALDGIAPEIRQSLSEAAQKANEYLDTLNSMSQSWGQEFADLMRLPAARRLELAKKLNTPKFAQMSKLIGPFTREAIAENKRKVTNTPEEIVDLTFGDDLPRVIPPELARFDLEETELLFLKDLVEHNLVQYEMKGFEKLARGGIIYCHDGSGSMGSPSQREIWAKAIGLALLHVARKQKRSFYGIQFGSPGQIRVDDFRDTRKLTPEKVIDFAEFFFGGGTCFQTPLTHAMEILKRENAEFGAVQSDIVFATDGQAPISEQFMRNFKELQHKLDCKVWGVAIAAGESGNPREAGLQREPLNTLCDGKVATIQSLLNAKDLKDVFRGI